MNQKIIYKNFLITLLFLFVLGSCMNPTQQGNVLIISTSSGVSKGVLNKNVITWEDIPYAIPPEGDLPQLRQSTQLGGDAAHQAVLVQIKSFQFA